MTSSSRLLPLGLLTLSLGVLAPAALAGGRTAPSAVAAVEPADTTDRLIVRMRERVVADPQLKVAQLAGRLGEKLRHRRVMADGNLVVELPRRMARLEAALVAKRLAADATVAYAEPDLLMKPLRVPNDGLYAQQWHYHEAVGGINLPAAWDITVGSSAVTVAVIDTGVRPHADLASRLVAGYDFIGDLTTANDGNGRDADASDPGDFGCNGSASSWHGTHVAGTIGAATDNGGGVAGVNWVSKIQPIRVLGQCGGYTSDIADGMRWAAGIAVPGVPANATPSRVLNLSLGGSGACGTTFQNAINDVVARGAVVVVAAGNSGVDVANATPANCSGVIAVAATTRFGGRASFSNYGTRVAIAAPGGGAGHGILSTLNAGGTTPGADNYAYYQGTSMATPHVAGVVSLMLSADPTLTPAQVLSRLQSSARAFPTGTGLDCTTSLCGAGIVDAAAALRAGSPTPPPAGSRVNLALASAGAVATASSTYSASFPATAVNNGDRRGLHWGAGGGWNDNTASGWPDWVQIDFGGSRTVAEIGVFTLQDAYGSPAEPTEAMTFGQYGITDFEVQYWTGTAWQTVPGGSVTGNNRVWRRFAFAPVTTSRIRVNVVRSLGGYSRVVEIEAYETAELPPAAPAPFNAALATNGGSASASSSYVSGAFPVSSLIDGDTRGTRWGAGGGWNDDTASSWPDTVQVDFGTARSLSEIGVYTLQDAFGNPQEPTEAMTFSQYGVTDFDVQYWNGTAWITVPGGSVTGNNRVWRRFPLSPSITTSSIRVVVRGSLGGYSRLVEIQAFGL